LRAVFDVLRVAARHSAADLEKAAAICRRFSYLIIRARN
jgi:hypothetical protein